MSDPVLEDVRWFFFCVEKFVHCRVRCSWSHKVKGQDSKSKMVDNGLSLL